MTSKNRTLRLGLRFAVLGGLLAAALLIFRFRHGGGHQSSGGPEEPSSLGALRASQNRLPQTPAEAIRDDAPPPADSHLLSAQQVGAVPNAVPQAPVEPRPPPNPIVNRPPLENPGGVNGQRPPRDIPGLH
jgi:hypothetical protein